ncbi:uncharacterized protein LOC135094106 [Scylla paramamosain]|uniref:uncharacterized protein LOC135094106 n=1 Tax=Scylla paramamosain TaxID=85552 RepID=UPI00308380E5
MPDTVTSVMGLGTQRRVSDMESVWVLLLASLLVVFVVTAFIHRSQNTLLTGAGTGIGTENGEGNPGSVWWTSCLWTVCSSLAQSSTWWPSGSALRIVAGTWLLMVLILTTVYRSNLKAMIIIPKMRLPFNSMAELLETDIPCYVPRGSIIHLLMELYHTLTCLSFGYCIIESCLQKP